MKKILLLLTFVSSTIVCKYSEIVIAAKNNDINKVHELLKSGVKPDSVGKTPFGDVEDENGNITILYENDDETALTFAARNNNLELMRILVNAGANVSHVDGCYYPHAGKPILRYAIDNHSLEAINLLLKNGANPNAYTGAGFIPRKNMNCSDRNIPILSHAINIRAPLEIIQSLINAGADINAKTMIVKYTPLIIAICSGNIEAAKLLINLGADIKHAVKEDNNKIALDYAQEYGIQEIYDILLKTSK